MKIGIFDSGIGGTSIWKEIVTLLPKYPTIYLSDSINAPYGERSKQEIIDLCFKNTRVLIEAGASIIVVACNTATTNAIEELRAHFDIPFIGIEPAIKPAALASTTKTVGILATQGTLNSQLFAKTSKNFKDIHFIEQIGKGLVEHIEAGDLQSEALKALLVSYLKPMIDQRADHIVLGCSHYPYLIPLIEEIIGKDTPIIDSGFAVATQTRRILNKEQIFPQDDSQGVLHQFYSNSKDLNPLKMVLATDLPLQIKVDYRDF